jgi:hypothetical protein
LHFEADAINFTSLVFIAFAVWTMTAVATRKTDHNLPLTFYFVTLAFNRSFERGLNVDLLLIGAAVAALIRFEFMSKGVVKFFCYFEQFLLVLIIWNFLQVIFGTQLALRI